MFIFNFQFNSHCFSYFITLLLLFYVFFILLSVVLFFFCFFFFKQKTAYEMRISDWSSDVCSSDLSVFPKCLDLVAGHAAVDYRPALPAIDFVAQQPKVDMIKRKRQRHANPTDSIPDRYGLTRLGQGIAPSWEESRVGQGGGRTCRSSWSQDN